MIDLAWILKHKVFGRSRYYEQPVMDHVKRVRGNMFVDVGANIGRYAIRLARNFKTIHAFEPNPYYFHTLKENAPRNIVLHPSALSDTDGECLLYLNIVGHGGSADTILKEFHYNPADNPKGEQKYVGSEEQSVRVPMNRFDTLFKEDVDLVKIDVEGAEFLVLAGMERGLSEQTVKRLVVELHDASQRFRLEELFMRKHYRTGWLDPTHLYAWAKEVNQ